MHESRRSLYPDIEPFDNGMLPVSDLHTLYFEQCGNPHGKPVVFLHGGPGAGCNAKCR
ncbi:MAG TPA: prolyl aminopeptidase, partial [Rhodanobacteraceae bacterium]|nr:prolyl aminopeptidase [Rhodanobacteraceae bacterium]